MSEKNRSNSNIIIFERETLGTRNFALRGLMRLLKRELWNSIDLDPYIQKEIEGNLAIGRELYTMMLQSKSPDSHELYKVLEQYEYECVIKRNIRNDSGE